MNQEVVKSSTTNEKMHDVIRVALVGSPNSGKTTLFNALTGSRQKTGNYPGVTVERKEGLVNLAAHPSATAETVMSILDLPGLYSLTPKSPDEEVSALVIRGEAVYDQKPEIIVAVADSTNLERHLYLVTELRELGIPMILTLTMSDLARKAGLKVDTRELEKRLGIPVVETSAVKGSGLSKLVDRLLAMHLQNVLDGRKGTAARPRLPNTADFIQARYKFIEDIMRECVQRPTTAHRITDAIDRVVLHRVAGPVIMAALFALLFQAMFSAAQVPMDFIESTIGVFGEWVQSVLPEGILADMLVNGVIAGVGSVVVFLPQILILFAFIIAFEDSGYMARAAFILDRLMTKFGLNGRAFIPLLSSFACAIPGVMATRTIDSRRDRLITILVAPLMTCSARLPVYAMLIAAFIPPTVVFGFFTMPMLVMFFLYFGAVIAAGVISWAIGKTMLKGQATPFIIELPTYKIPSLRNLLMGLYDRSRIFLRKAGTIILSLSIILWVLASYPKVEVPATVPETEHSSYQLEQSFLGRLGHSIEPLVEPLGYDWKIGAALISSFAAREVVLSTLGTIYAVEADDSAALSERLQTSVNPKTGKLVFTLPVVLSLLVFYMFACQCISTIAVVRRETNSWRWPLFMFAYMTALAYGGAFLTYRVAQFFWS